MNATTIGGAVALGALTGMRSMAGPATLAWQYDGWAPRVAALLAAGEMVADKLPQVGDRIDPLPLAGRAVLGAIVGGIFARRAGHNALVGGLVGSAAAVCTAHLAYRIRARLPVSDAIGGVIEDAVVMGLSAVYASAAHGSPRRKPRAARHRGGFHARDTQTSGNSPVSPSL